MDGETRFARLVGDAVADSMARHAENKRPGQDKSPRAFSRVHPTRVFSGAAGGPDLGANLACLRYMSRNPAAGVHQVNVGQGFSLALDPRYTAPNAAVAVSFHGGSAWNEYTILHPGDVLEVPDGFTRFWCFNADQQDQFFDLVNQPANANLGYCAFVVGHVPGAVPTFADATPVGLAALIQHGALGAFSAVPRANVATVGFSTGHLRAIRVTIEPRTAAGAVNPTPRIYAAIAAAYAPRPLQAATPIFPPDTQTADSGPFAAVGHVPIVGEVQGYGHTVAGGAFQPQHQLVFEIPAGQLSGQLCLAGVPGGTFLDYTASALYAPAVATANLYAFIEGVR